MSGYFVPAGIAILLIGLATLVRPGAVRALLRIPEGEASTYALRIAGMMIAAFGLILAGCATAYRLSAAAALGAQGAG